MRSGSGERCTGMQTEITPSRRHRRPIRRAWITLAGPWVVLSLALAWPRLASGLDNTPEPRQVRPGGANYVIVAPAGLAESAEAWAAYRRAAGYSVQLLVVTPAESTAEHVSTAASRLPMVNPSSWSSSDSRSPTVNRRANSRPTGSRPSIDAHRAINAVARVAGLR